MSELSVSDIEIEPLQLAGPLLIRVPTFEDERGRFFEAWRAGWRQAAGIPAVFVQDNVSVSRARVIRGLHLQNPEPQGKLVSVLHGRIFDVLVDVRVGSPTFAAWDSVEMGDADGKQLYIPPGFAHGFAVLSDVAVVTYKCTTYYNRTAEICIRWNDPRLDINWPYFEPVLSPKDASAPGIDELTHRLPVYPA